MSELARRTLTRAGRTLSFLDSAPAGSERPVVLLLHGFPDDATMWEPVAARLHADGYRVIAPTRSAAAGRRSRRRCTTTAWTR